MESLPTADDYFCGIGLLDIEGYINNYSYFEAFSLCVNNTYISEMIF